MKKLILLSFLFSLSCFSSPQGVPGRTAITVGNTSTMVLPANINRGYLIIQNQTSGTCSVVFGSPIVSGEGLQILTGGNYEPVEAFVKSSVYMVCVSPGIIELDWTNY